MYVANLVELMIRKLIKYITCALADDYYNIALARDYLALKAEFQNIVNNSKEYLYLSCGSPKPVLLRDDFRDLIIARICMNVSGLDMKVLINEKLFHDLNYYDSTFRVTKSNIIDFVVGDAGNMIMVPHSWNFGKIRAEYPGEDIKKTFLQAYNLASL